MPDFKMGSFPLGEHDTDWFIVMCKLSSRSIRANVGVVISDYVHAKKQEFQAILEYTARKYGLTPEECFYRLLNDESLGTPIKDFTEKPPVT